MQINWLVNSRILKWWDRSCHGSGRQSTEQGRNQGFTLNPGKNDSTLDTMVIAFPERHNDHKYILVDSFSQIKHLKKDTEDLENVQKKWSGWRKCFCLNGVIFLPILQCEFLKCYLGNTEFCMLILYLIILCKPIINSSNSPVWFSQIF